LTGVLHPVSVTYQPHRLPWNDRREKERTKKKKKLEIWGRAQRAVAQRCKSDWRDNLGKVGVKIPLLATSRDGREKERTKKKKERQEKTLTVARSFFNDK